MIVRLNKFLSESGIASRRKSEEFIKEGRVSINGNIVTELSVTVDLKNDIVKVDGERIKPEKKVYYLLHKPKGYITTTNDEKGRKKVTDLIKSREKIFPVGRLDFDTTGVLILTNDGDFSNFITHPGNGITRIYNVVLFKILEESDRQKLLTKIYLDKRRSKFESVEFAYKNSRDRVKVVTVEGRNHFVKRMFGAVGHYVKRLERVNFGGFEVRGMPPGSYRKISYSEIEKFYKTYAK